MAIIYYLGQDVPISCNVVNDLGNPANATVVVTVTAPDGTTQTPATTNLATGAYSAVVPAVAQVGTYLSRWVASGSGFTFVSETQWQVSGSALEQVVDLASVKAHLNLSATDRSQDDELRGFILAAGPIIRDIIGPLLPETHVEYFNGGVGTLSLSWQPVLSIQSAYEYYGLSAFLLTEQPLGTQMNAFAFTVDYVTGQLTRRTFGGQAALFAIGDKNIKVTYTAGRGTDVPYNVRLGALELIRHLWQVTQQGGRTRLRGASAGGGDEMAVPIGFAVPDRVVELLAPHRRPPGIA